MSTGCAAILGSKEKSFDLQSTPQGADVLTDGTRLGTTPLKVKLSNTKTHTFVFRKEGYKETTCQLSRGTGGGWVILDVLMGLVPVIIDAATNSWSQTQGTSCSGALEPLDRIDPNSRSDIAAESVLNTQGASSSGVQPSSAGPAPSPGQAIPVQRDRGQSGSVRVADAPPVRSLTADAPAPVVGPREGPAVTSRPVSPNRPEFTCDGLVTGQLQNPQDELRRQYVADLRRLGLIQCVEEVSSDLVRVMAGPQYRNLSSENRDYRLLRLYGSYGSPVHMVFEIWDSAGRFAEYSALGYREIPR
jgi:hypothetical protein